MKVILMFKCRKPTKLQITKLKLIIIDFPKGFEMIFPFFS